MMKPLEITIAITPADLAPWKGAEVPVRFIITETTIHVRFDPPPEKQSFMDQLRKDFKRIEPYFSGQSLAIMRFLLDTHSGEAVRKTLIEHIWDDYTPTSGRVRNAIAKLNNGLKRLEFGYKVKCHRTGRIQIILQ